MQVKQYNLPSVYEITLNPHIDDRGHFIRIFDHDTFKNHGLDRDWRQENLSYSKRKGTIRGLHFQLPPFTETKLIRVIRGAIFDVWVDLRKDSPTFGKWDSIELSEDNYKMIFLPRGFAHGFCSLTDNCEIMYKVDNVYSAEHEGGILWRDEMLDINWPITSPILSKKDASLPKLKDFLNTLKHLSFS
jgi:dTDP-4-dehydrorhamnose 3,5-epimerase